MGRVIALLVALLAACSSPPDAPEADAAPPFVNHVPCAIAHDCPDAGACRRSTCTDSQCIEGAVPNGWPCPSGVCQAGACEAMP